LEVHRGTVAGGLLDGDVVGHNEAGGCRVLYGDSEPQAVGFIARVVTGVGGHGVVPQGKLGAHRRIVDDGWVGVAGVG